MTRRNNDKPRLIHRRRFLHGLAGASLAVPMAQMFTGSARAVNKSDRAERVIFFFFPDGVPGASQIGEPSRWHPSGSESDFTLPDVLSPLASLKDDCVFFNGLTSGPADNNNHPGGAKKLLTNMDGGNGQSIDQFLAQTVGADRPFRHLYLGVQANVNNASGDKHISYPSAGNSTPPQDNPIIAFDNLFGSVGGGGGGGPDPDLLAQKSVIDNSLAELNELRAQLGDSEAAKLDIHLEALREIELRVQGLIDGGSGGFTCENPSLDTGSLAPDNLYDPAVFPDIMRAQIDVMVQAMACGLTRVGVLQASHHTSELIMSRFPGTEMYDPNFDMRSHQASHYGDRHDEGRREFTDFVKQRRWFVEQFAYLISSLAALPEGDGTTMLDNSVILLMSEVEDGNTHSHYNLPFILAGRAGGRISTGRLLQYNNHRHGDLLTAIAQSMGSDVGGWGQDSYGPLPGLIG